MTMYLIILFLKITTTVPVLGEESPWLLSTTELPSDFSNPKFMPTLGNGQLAVTPYLGLDPEVPPSITANCLYNGDSWNSHRARIPNYSNYKLINAEFVAKFESEEFLVKHQVL